MKIKEVTIENKLRWDSFVDANRGDFGYYFDYRYLSDNINQIMVESDENELVGIYRFDKEKKRWYSTIRTNGFLFRRDLAYKYRYQATREMLDYIEKNYSKHCSTFIVQEYNKEDYGGDGLNYALIDHGFRFRNYARLGVPCSHILPLKAPFEENIWKGIWSQKLRQDLNRVVKSGIGVIQDRKFEYLESYIDMYIANYKRHRLPPPNRDEIAAEFNIFKDKIKMFVAIDSGKPIVILKCNYTLSTCYLTGIGSYSKDTNDANKLCYKVAIEDACNNGYQFVNFGYSYTEGLAKLKDRFKFTRIPIRIYEKRYSVPRVFLELTPALVKSYLQDPGQLRKNSKVILERITHW